MRAVLAYGAASAVVLVLLALMVVPVFRVVDAGAVRTAAVIAWPVQLAAFGVLLAGRARASFVAGWAGGMALRFGAVGASAIWVTRADGPDPATLLVSLVGFVFVLVLLEPLFLRLTN